MKTTGRSLAKKWGVAVEHALYHHEGTWFHHLERFPGALFDAGGYVRFENKDDYQRHPRLQHKNDLHVEGGIRSLPGYVHFAQDGASGVSPS